MKKTYILDTNVLLSDPKSIFSFEENDIILPYIVLEELDKFKTRQDELGSNAREVNRQLSNLIKESSGNLREGIKLETGGIIKAVSAESYNNNLPLELKTDKNDHIILSVCLDNNQSILVTNDLLLRILADSCGIVAEEYRKNALAKSINTMYSGIRHVSVTRDELADIWNISHNKNQDNLKTKLLSLIPDLLPNEFAYITNGEASKPFIARINKNKIRVLPEEYKLTKIKSKNIEQLMAIDLLLDPDIKLVTIVGRSGSGKTLSSIAAGLEQVIDKKLYKSLVVLRPIQPVGKDIGYLPGSTAEKLEPWIAPIKDNLSYLMSYDDNGNKKILRNKNDKFNPRENLDYLFDRGIIEVEALTYIRGRSIAEAFMLIDESQNLNAHEIKTIITRVGEGTKVILTGDVEQIDNIYVDSITNGLAVAVEKFKQQSIAGHITLTKCERSELASIASEIL